MRWVLHGLMVTILLAVSVVAGATVYPLRVVDLAGREVVVPAPPQRIFVQNGNALTALSLLDRENPFARVVGWHNTLGNSDPGTWELMRQRWPEAARVPTLAFDSSGHVDLEALVRLRPDLVLLDIETRPAVEGGRIAPILARLGIPSLYIDSARDPVANLQKSLALLGQVLDREARAQAYLDFYRQRLAVLQAVAAQAVERPRVFIEVRAGRMGLDQCCYSQGNTGWGPLIDAVGGRNIASQLLPGATGDVALETLIRLQPDVYLMTGTQRVRRGARAVPLGYGASEEEAGGALAALMARPGFGATGRRTGKGPGACVHALHHQFYDSAFNIVALEYLARALHPMRFADLRPEETYREVLRRFTALPDAPFLFHLSRAYADGGPCEP